MKNVSCSNQYSVISEFHKLKGTKATYYRYLSRALDLLKLP